MRSHLPWTYEHPLTGSDYRHHGRARSPNSYTAMLADGRIAPFCFVSTARIASIPGNREYGAWMPTYAPTRTSVYSSWLNWSSSRTAATSSTRATNCRRGLPSRQIPSRDETEHNALLLFHHTLPYRILTWFRHWLGEWAGGPSCQNDAFVWSTGTRISGGDLVCEKSPKQSRGTFACFGSTLWIFSNSHIFIIYWSSSLPLTFEGPSSISIWEW